MRISWTRYKSFDECKLQYHLRYNVKAKRIKSQVAFFIGSAVHRAVTEWARAGYPTGFMESRVAEMAKRALPKWPIEYAKKLDLLRKSVKGAILTEKQYRELEFIEHRAYIETDFVVHPQGFGNNELIGSIDVYDPVVKAVYDLKMHTTELFSDPAQMLTYAVAVEAKGWPVETLGFITPLLDQKTHLFETSHTEIEVQREVLKDAAEVMSRPLVSKEPTEGQHCFFCEYRNTSLCPATFKEKGSGGLIFE